VIIEAQLAGVAVIATAAGGAQELVAEGTTGHLVPMGDPLTLADMLVRLIDDPDGRTRIALAGQAWAREQFDSARLAAGVDDIHRSAMQAYR
jgi:glycosyltransferase involved in cell wall biosynthesis